MLAVIKQHDKDYLLKIEQSSLVLVQQFTNDINFFYSINQKRTYEI